MLIYHSVAELAARGSGRVGSELFERQMEYLDRSGYRTLTPDEFISATQRGTWPVKSLFITFDDGYFDFYEHAFPVLRRHGFTATVFPITDVLEAGLGSWEGPHPDDTPPPMGWAEVEKMQGEGIFFGSHGTGHRFLGSLSPDELAEEAVRSKEVLESRLGVDVSMFAYPYGDCTEATKAALVAAGYKVGFGLNAPTTSWFDIQRRAIPPARTIMPFVMRVSAAYPLLRRAARIMRGHV